MKKHIVTLTADERDELIQLTQTGNHGAQRIKRAHILLKADSVHPAARWTDEQIAKAFHTHLNTVAEIRKRFVLNGLEATVQGEPKGHRACCLDGEAEAHLIAIACSPAPEGHDHWTLRVLAERMVELEYAEQLSYETVRQVLKKTH